MTRRHRNNNRGRLDRWFEGNWTFKMLCHRPPINKWIFLSQSFTQSMFHISLNSKLPTYCNKFHPYWCIKVCVQMSYPVLNGFKHMRLYEVPTLGDRCWLLWIAMEIVQTWLQESACILGHPHFRNMQGMPLRLSKHPCWCCWMQVGPLGIFTCMPCFPYHWYLIVAYVKSSQLKWVGANFSSLWDLGWQSKSDANKTVMGGKIWCLPTQRHVPCNLCQ